jgi:hypothetical protein
MKKIILHLCADIGSDSVFYQNDDEYEVIMVGEDIGVENFTPPPNVHGVICNPVCTEFSSAKNSNLRTVPDLSMVKHCQRIIAECSPEWWVIENPATGTMRDFLGKPDAVYQPWEYGSPWTKRTALWGNFKMPPVLYNNWDDVPKNPNFYVRPGRPKPSLAFLHKSAMQFLPEYNWCRDRIKTDADFRSLCSTGFANEFKKANG